MDLRGGSEAREAREARDFTMVAESGGPVLCSNHRRSSDFITIDADGAVVGSKSLCEEDVRSPEGSGGVWGRERARAREGRTRRGAVETECREEGVPPARSRFPAGAALCLCRACPPRARAPSFDPSHPVPVAPGIPMEQIVATAFSNPPARRPQVRWAERSEIVRAASGHDRPEVCDLDRLRMADVRRPRGLARACPRHAPRAPPPPPRRRSTRGRALATRAKTSRRAT